MSLIVPESVTLEHGPQYGRQFSTITLKNTSNDVIIYKVQTSCTKLLKAGHSMGLVRPKSSTDFSLSVDAAVSGAKSRLACRVLYAQVPSILVDSVSALISNTTPQRKQQINDRFFANDPSKADIALLFPDPNAPVFRADSAPCSECPMLRETIERLREEVRSTRASLADANGRLGQLEHDAFSAESTRTALNEQLAAANALSSAREQETSELRDQLEALKSERDSLQAQISELEDNVTQLSQRPTSPGVDKQSYIAAQSRLTACEARITECENELDQKVHDLAVATGRAERLTRELETSKMQEQQTLARAEDAERRLEELQARMEEVETALAHSHQSTDGASAQVDVLTKHLNETKERAEALETRALLAEQRATAAENQAERLSTRLEAAKSEADELRASAERLPSLDQQVAQLTRQLAGADTRVRDAETARQATQNELEQVRADNEELKASLQSMTEELRQVEDRSARGQSGLEESLNAARRRIAELECRAADAEGRIASAESRAEAADTLVSVERAKAEAASQRAAEAEEKLSRLQVTSQPSSPKVPPPSGETEHEKLKRIQDELGAFAESPAELIDQLVAARSELAAVRAESMDSDFAFCSHLSTVHARDAFRAKALSTISEAQAKLKQASDGFQVLRDMSVDQIVEGLKADPASKQLLHSAKSAVSLAAKMSKTTVAQPPLVLLTHPHPAELTPELQELHFLAAEANSLIGQLQSVSTQRAALLEITEKLSKMIK